MTQATQTDRTRAGEGGAFVSVRIVTTDDRGTRRTDLTLRGARGIATGDGGGFDFDAADTWTVVRRLLPRLAALRAAPAPTRITGPTSEAELEGLTDRARGFVALVVAVGDEADDTEDDGTVEEKADPVISVRSWLATDDACYAVPQDGSTPIRMAHGALAEHLMWDLTGALQALTERWQAAS